MKRMQKWWFSLFPRPMSAVEAEVRAHAIGAFWGLAAFFLMMAALCLWVLLS